MNKLALLFVLIISGITGGAAAAAPRDSVRLMDAPSVRDMLLGLTAERLEQMPLVAAAKWRDGKAISDPMREREVLASIRQDAIARGLEPDAVAALFELQMRLAREAQERAFARWRAEGCTHCAQAPALSSLRQLLDGIGKLQLETLYLFAPLTRDTTPPEAASALLDRLAALIPEAASRTELLERISAIHLQGATGLARARANGVLRFGVPGDYAPFALQHEGELGGADIELAGALAAALGLRPVFLRSSWPTLSADLQRDGFDIAVGGVSITPERAALGRFSAPYHSGGKTLLSRCADAARFSDPARVNRPQVRLIVNRGGTNESVARALLPAAALQVYPDNIGVFAEVAEGRADVMLTDDVEAALKSAQDPRLCRSYAGTLNRVDKALWMAPDAALAQAVDKWLAAALATGDPARWLAEAMQVQEAAPAAAPKNK